MNLEKLQNIINQIVELKKSKTELEKLLSNPNYNEEIDTFQVLIRNKKIDNYWSCKFEGDLLNLNIKLHSLILIKSIKQLENQLKQLINES